jgi:hypothetical protein
MKIFGIRLQEGTQITNLTVGSGTSFPTSPNEGELFFRSDASLLTRGLWLYVGGNWDRIASTDSLTVPNGASLPAQAQEGDIFFRNSNDSNEGLYVYSNGAWGTVGTSANELEAEISKSVPPGSIGQVPFISVDGTRETEQGYTVIPGQFIESDAELTEAQTRIVSQEDIFNEWYRFSHQASAGGTLTRTANVSRFQFTSSNLATVSASFPVGSTIQVVSVGNPSFNGTWTVSAVSASGQNHVVFWNQEAADATSVTGIIQLDSLQPAYPAELTAWSYDAINDRVVCTVNSDSHLGFISQNRFSSYEHEVVLRSTNSDDDSIGVVLAWAVVGGREYTLTAIRSTGGQGFTWRVVYNFSRSDSITVQDKTTEVKWGNGGYGATAGAAGYVANAALGGWDDFPAGTRVKITRDNDIFTVQTSDLGESTYVSAATITVDLTSAAYLEKFRGPREIGYSTSSQASSSFEILSFSDSANDIYDIRNGNVYRYVVDSWELQPFTLTEAIGPGKLLYDIYTEKLFWMDPILGATKIGDRYVARHGDTMDGPLVVTTNTTETAVRITQTGAGAALLVEDSANPDSTPFTVLSDGKVLIGSDTVRTASSGIVPQLQLNTNNTNIGAAFNIFGTTALGSALYFLKTRSTVPSDHSAVLSNDALGSLIFEGSDGVGFFRGALIQSVVDATPATGSVPAALVFSTTAAGDASPTERLRISSAGALRVSSSFGIAGQVLTSQGSSAPPQWTTPPGSGTVTSVAIEPAGVGISVSGSPITSSGTITITSNATNSNTPSTIVARDGSGNFSAGVVTVGQLSLPSNASIRTFSSGDPIVNGLTTNSDFGLLIDGVSNGHVVVALDSNDDEESFYVMSYTTDNSTSANKAMTNVALRVTRQGNMTVSGSMTGTQVNLPVSQTATATLTTSTTAAGQVLATFPSATYRSAKFLVQISSGTSHQITELNMVHNGTTVFMTEFGTVNTSSDLASFAADVSGGNVRLLTTPANAVTTYKVVRTSITA